MVDEGPAVKQRTSRLSLQLALPLRVLQWRAGDHALLGTEVMQTEPTGSSRGDLELCAMLRNPPGSCPELEAAPAFETMVEAGKLGGELGSARVVALACTSLVNAATAASIWDSLREF